MEDITTRVIWQEGMRFCSHTKSGKIMCDESSLVGRAYPSSPELLMASLGSCIGSVLVVFADRHDIDLEGMTIDLDWELAEKPRRIGNIAVAVNIPIKLSKKHLNTLAQVANSCLIHATLLHPPEIELKLTNKSSH